jgi:hypothetical protein
MGLCTQHRVLFKGGEKERDKALKRRFVRRMIVRFKRKKFWGSRGYRRRPELDLGEE